MDSAHSPVSSSLAVPATPLSTSLAWSVTGQVHSLFHKAYRPKKFAGGLLLRLIVVIHFAWGLTLPNLFSPFYRVESSPYFGEGLAVTQGDAELSCSHLCPKVLVSGRPCVFLGVAVLSREPAEAFFSLSKAGSLNLSGVLALLTI